MQPVAHAHNHKVADRLLEAARLLQSQGASPARVRAYREAAEAVAALPRAVERIFEEGGVRALDAIPGMGLGIAASVGEMLATGRLGMLERLCGRADPRTLFRTLAGIGPSLAERIHDELHVDSLEGLDAAAHDGRLENVPGVGERRAAAVRASLDSMLRRPAVPLAAGAAVEPRVELILDVDREYREKAAAGTLRTIAPRRLNPAREAWLPVLHATRGPWHFTALFSNSALAHRLGRTRDWVLVYFYDGDHRERQRTVVTEMRGEAHGRRVVRGRERECRSRIAA